MDNVKCLDFRDPVIDKYVDTDLYSRMYETIDSRRFKIYCEKCYNQLNFPYSKDASASAELTDTFERKVIRLFIMKHFLMIS